MSGERGARSGGHGAGGGEQGFREWGAGISYLHFFYFLLL
jgi:hypothetical protein